MFRPLDDILNLSEEERNKQYLDDLKLEIQARPNKEELDKNIIITDEGSLFIHSFMTNKEHEELIKELGKDGVWFYPICTKDEIPRILNPQSTKDILLKKQAEYIVDHMRTLRVFRKRKEICENEGSTWSITNYYDKNKNFTNYINTLKPYMKRQCKSVEAGFIVMSEVNGICEKTEFGNIIYLSESLSHFLHFMNFAIMDFGGFEIGTQERSDSFFIAMRVMLGVESLDFDLDPRYDSLPSAVVEANNNLVDKQLMFIIGHEYAHHLLNHLNNSKMYNTNSSDNKEKIQKIYNYSQKQEFEADWFAFKNSKLKKDEKAEMLNGAFLFFVYLDIYETIVQYTSPYNTKISTHPEPLDRLWKLRGRIKNSIGYSKHELNNLIENAKQYKNFLIDEALPYKPDLFEFYGSIYLTKYKTKKLMDRIDY